MSNFVQDSNFAVPTQNLTTLSGHEPEGDHTPIETLVINDDLNFDAMAKKTLKRKSKSANNYPPIQSPRVNLSMDGEGFQPGYLNDGLPIREAQHSPMMKDHELREFEEALKGVQNDEQGFNLWDSKRERRPSDNQIHGLTINTGDMEAVLPGKIVPQTTSNLRSRTGVVGTANVGPSIFAQQHLQGSSQALDTQAT